MSSRIRQRLRRTMRRARWGNLRRLEPISPRFGFDRGTPIDRHYTEAFLAVHASTVRGTVGEVAGDEYARHFGGNDVDRIEIIDVDPENSRATLLADLTCEGSLPAGTFDCLIVTQTLQYVPDPAIALRTCADALRAGGTLLLAVPALTPHDDLEPADTDYWRFWPAGVRKLVLDAFPPQTDIEVMGLGNLITAVAFLHGLASEELSPDEFDRHDPRFPVVVHARATLARPAHADPSGLT